MNDEKVILKKAVPLVIKWYLENKRDLPWRNGKNAYHIWVSEIMLQQTRVEAVKPFYARFLEIYPSIEALAEAKEDELLKVWEGLGYYNRVRNMQIAARQIVSEHKGRFPETYEETKRLKGIGNYTAGAISSFAFGIAKPAVDGNVLRVVTRVLGSYDDIAKVSTRTIIEEKIEAVIPKDAAGDFNQGMIELGAIICVPNAAPKCRECPLKEICIAKQSKKTNEIPVKTKKPKRKIEKKTVLILWDGRKVAIKKRPNRGLLAGLYEFPNLEGHLSEEEILIWVKSQKISPIQIEKIEEAKHIFTHLEWHMKGYKIRIEEIEEESDSMIFLRQKEIQESYSLPSAFERYAKYMQIIRGKRKVEREAL